MTKIFETDPRFTAYLLGELPAEEAKEVERLLGEHPEDAAEWEKTRNLIAQLEETLENEAIPAAMAENPLIFKEKPKMDTNKTNEPKKRRWLWRLTGVAAMLVVVAGLALFLMPTEYLTHYNWRMVTSQIAKSSAPHPSGHYIEDSVQYSNESAYHDSAEMADEAESLATSPNEKLRKNRESSRYANMDMARAPEDSAFDLPGVEDSDEAEAFALYEEAEISAEELSRLREKRVATYGGDAVLSPEVDIPLDDALTAPIVPAEKPAVVEVEPMGIGNLQGSDVGKSIAEFSGSGSGMGMRKAAKKSAIVGSRGRLAESREEKEMERQVMSYLSLPASPQDEVSAERPADPHAGMKDETYKAFVENVFEDPAAKPFSTFGIDVDSASYTVMRQYLNDRNAKPPAQSVRVEEYINYFKYALAPPAAEDKTPFAVKTDLFAHPWQDGLMMMKITLKGKEMAKDTRPPLNLVFLLDVSGSMSSWNRLPLVKSSMIELLDELTERDRVAIVTYANGTQVNLTPTAVTEDGRHTIRNAINSLGASGGTSGGAGLKLAYAEAQKNFNGEAVNRIVLCTDGDFNIGETGDPAMEEIVSEGAKTGVFLTVLGFGMGNYKDARLKLLSDKGNGNYGYIDTAEEARRLLVENLTGTMITIAKDVKIQLDFNPKYIAAYRLIGYENRKMAAKDFNDDKKDSGEIGAGHTVTALYEIVPKGIRIPHVEPVSRYSEDAAKPQPEEEVIEPGEMLTVALRYKMPDSDTSTLMEFKQPSPESLADLPRMDAESHFASAVALYAMLLRQSEYTGSATLDTVLELAQPGVGDSAARKEFVELVKTAKTR